MTPRLPPDNARGTVGIGRQDLEALRRFRTPLVCEALEHLAPERRTGGHTVRPLDCAFSAAAPIVGHARTAIVSTAVSSSEAAEGWAQWLEHLRAGPKPTVAVWQDLGGGSGACLDAVIVSVHRALGCTGMVIDGAIRSIGGMPEAMQILHRGLLPSGSWPHIVAFGCEVNVAGMSVRDGDIVHLDRHGAVLVPEETVRDIPETANGIERQRAALLDACRTAGADMERLKPFFTGGQARC